MSPQQRRLLRAGVVALAAVVALVAWVASGDGDDGGGESAAPPEPSAARAVTSEAELAEVGAALGQPVYWAGIRPGAEIELTELPEGGTQVSYLPEGAEGEGEAAVLTIGSYPLPDPKAALEGFADQPGATVRRAEDGTEVVSSAESPSSVYFASPDNSVQVEVYDPSPESAMELALSGEVRAAE